MSDQLRQAQQTALAQFSADRQRLDEDLSLPFAETAAQRIERARRVARYSGKSPEMTEELRRKIEERERQNAAEIEAIRNPPIEQRFARIVGKDYAGCRLETFEIKPDWSQKAQQQAREVLARLQSVAGSVRQAVAARRGLWLCGPPGVGKDHLVAGVMWAAINAGLSCKWTNGGSFASLAMDQFGDDRQPERIWMQDWVRPDVLTISDPDGNRSTGPTDHVKDTLYKVVDARYREGKPTWITINGTNPAIWKERLLPRIVDRLIHDAWLLPCEWPGSRQPRGVVQ